jgi:predicted metal-dependent hydrolase
MDHLPLTPADLVIKPRNTAFVQAQRQERWWKNGDPVATAFYNSLSAVFPLGEAFFIDSVRHYRDVVSPHLQQQVDAFIKQEGAHSREHSQFNRLIKDAGYDISSMDADMAAWRAEAKSQPPDVNLAITVANEHLTAIIAHVVLTNRRYFKHDSPQASRLWEWHALEEIEHKAVAYDTFFEITKDLSNFARWKFRCLVLLLVSGSFVVERIRFMSRFFKQDKIRTPLVWLRVFHYLLIYPGLFRQVLPAWLSFFRPSFHPWQQDDRELIAITEAKIALPLDARTPVQ